MVAMEDRDSGLVAGRGREESSAYVRSSGGVFWWVRGGALIAGLLFEIFVSRAEPLWPKGVIGQFRYKRCTEVCWMDWSLGS